MASIVPTSDVKLFTGVPLDDSYQNTLYFGSLSAQLTYFAGLTPLYTLNSNQYTRVTGETFEAGCEIGSVYNANYMMFKNTSYENKWFFAFVTRIDYINDHNCRIHFTLDVMQTWMFDITLGASFIERQHSATDEPGDNILPEPVATGEYVFENYVQLYPDLNHYAVAIMRVTVEANQSSNGRFHDGVYSGAAIYAIDANQQNAADLINSYLAETNPKPEEIINIYMIPFVFLPQTSNDYDQVQAVPQSVLAPHINVGTSQISSITDIDGYVPKNKKLFTYPYYFYHVDNGDGAGMSVRYEFFKNGGPQFSIEGCITPPVQARITPANYKGIEATASHEDRSTFLTISGYPVCSWNYDTYRAWMAQNSIPMEIAGGMAAAGVALAAATGGVGAVIPAAVGALSTAVNAASQMYKASQQADVCKGNVNSGNVNFACKKMTFYGGKCHVTRQQAVVIDDFFTMYGYAYNKVSIPNPNHRPKWYYVKTAGANIVGECPAEDLRKIISVYDHGVTFWHNASEVGHYWLDNSVSSGE